MYDIEIHDDENEAWGAGFQKELAELTKANDDVAVTLTGSPEVKIFDSAGNEVEGWADPDPQLNDDLDRVDFILDPPVGSAGNYRVEIRAPHTLGKTMTWQRRDRENGFRRTMTLRVFAT